MDDFSCRDPLLQQLNGAGGRDVTKQSNETVSEKNGCTHQSSQTERMLRGRARLGFLECRESEVSVFTHDAETIVCLKGMATLMKTGKLISRKLFPKAEDNQRGPPGTLPGTDTATTVCTDQVLSCSAAADICNQNNTFSHSYSLNYKITSQRPDTHIWKQTDSGINEVFPVKKCLL